MFVALFGGNQLLALPTFTEVSGSAQSMYKKKWVNLWCQYIRFGIYSESGQRQGKPQTYWVENY